MQVPQTEIIITQGGAEVLRQRLGPGEYVVGREATCSLRIEGTKVSRQHARLTVNSDAWLLADLGSANGTLLNGQPVGREGTRVFPTQTIQVGDFTIELRGVAEAATNSALTRVLPPEVRERRHRVGEVVAQGGMGAILSATDGGIRRQVAMKVMLNMSDEADVLRFVEEAQVTGQLEHPNIVPVHELGVDEQQQPYYTMKFVRGITLKKVLELLAAGTEATVAKYPLPALLTIFQKACDAVAFAHSKGVIHRDLKPENIMLGDFGEVLVMDWGLAKLIGSAETISTAKRDGGNLGSTMQGSVMGTPQYMAPEQARGEIETMDQRADIYALGAILYHLLALRPSVSDDDAWAIVDKVARGQIEPLDGGTRPPGALSKPSVTSRGDKRARRSRSTIPDSLAAVVRKAMAFDRAQRYASVPELQRDIEAYQGGFATSAENAGAWKQLTLFVRRNKAASIGAAAVLLVGATLGTKAIVEGRRAERMLGELRGTAPTFAEQARALVTDADFAGALQKIDYAVKLAPAEAEYHVLRGHILQSLLRFTDAEAAYRVALKHEPAHRVAAENAELSHKLATQLKDGVLPRAGYDALLRAMKAQGRSGEAELIAAHLGGASKEALEKWRPIIAKEFRGLRTELRPDEGGRLFLSLADSRDKTALLTDISALKGMPLRTLWLGDNNALTDLTPLAGAPIEELRNRYSRITDLSPLKGLPLRMLIWNYSGVLSDLSPLAGAPLEWLEINMCSVTNLSPLKGAPLRRLDIARTLVVDLSPLAGAPLEWLLIGGTRITDLTPLAGLPLKLLNIANTPVSDLSPLAGMKLETLTADTGNAKITDISALRGMPLRELAIQGTSVTDLSALADCTALEFLALPASQKAKLNLDPLRRLPKLDRIAFASRETSRKDAQPAAEFWKQYDAEKAK